MLVINGTVLLDPPTFRGMCSDKDTAETMAPNFAHPSNDGCIVKHFLEARWGEKNRGGGCYFFTSEEAIDKYLGSAFWAKCVKDTPWEQVEYEKYVVV